MSKVELRNDFHNTKACVFARDGIVSGRSMARARRKLCGMADCRCGQIRGPGNPEIEDLGWDGSVRIIDAR